MPESQAITSPDKRLLAAIVAAVLVHIGLGAGLHAANEYFTRDAPPPPMEITVVVQPPPAPPPPPPPLPEEAEPPPTPEPAKPPPPKTKKVKVEQPPPPREDQPPPPAQPQEPAPEAAPQKIYTMPGPGQVAVAPQPETGSAYGRPKAQGTQIGGSDTGGTGTGQSVSVAAIKTMPKPTGDYDYVDLGKDYPEAARRQGIEGEATYRIFVDETGKVTQVKSVKKLGYGLDEKGAELIRKIRFEPARDTNDKPVAVWRSWSIQFTLPR